jgi:hypothetical protein
VGFVGKIRGLVIVPLPMPASKAGFITQVVMLGCTRKSTLSSLNKLSK